MFTDLQASAAALYDGGWRSTDEEQLQAEYGLSDEETSAIIEALAQLEKTD